MENEIEININSGEKYDDDILNQSYEDIYSINEKKNAIEELGDSDVYQYCGKQHSIELALDKNGNKIGIAMGIKTDESITRNCLNYAFLASCGERVPRILRKFKKSDVAEGCASDFEVQSFFPHDGENNYFSPNAENVKMFVPYDSLDYKNRELYGFMIQDRTKEVIIRRSQYSSPDPYNRRAGYGAYLYTWHILTECGDEPKTEFIDHFATLFADELCFDIQDRNCGNILVIPSKNENRRDIVNIDVDFGWQKTISSRCYLEFYLIAKEVTFKFDEKLNEGYMNDHVNKNLNEKYKPRNSKVNFKFQPKQELKISPGIIAEIDKKIIEKIKQRLNFRKDKFAQYYIDNCIRRGDIDKKVACSDFQTFMKSLYEHLKKQAEFLKTNKDFGHFSKPFDEFMEKNKDYQSFNNLSAEDFNKKWDEREKALKNPKKMEEQKVDPIINEKIIDDTKGKKENEIKKGGKKEDENNIEDKTEEKKEEENDIKDESEIKKEDININIEINKGKEHEQENPSESNKNNNVGLFSDEIARKKMQEHAYNDPNSIFYKIKTEKDESEIKKENKTGGTYLMKCLLIILGLLFIAGGIALFFVAPTLALKFLAIGFGILGVAGFGVGFFYNKIVCRYCQKPGSCCISFLTYTIFEPKEKNKENDINLENQENNMITDK